MRAIVRVDASVAQEPDGRYSDSHVLSLSCVAQKAGGLPIPGKPRSSHATSPRPGPWLRVITPAVGHDRQRYTWCTPGMARAVT